MLLRFLTHPFSPSVFTQQIWSDLLPERRKKSGKEDRKTHHVRFGSENRPGALPWIARYLYKSQQYQSGHSDLNIEGTVNRLSVHLLCNCSSNPGLQFRCESKVGRGGNASLLHFATRSSRRDGRTETLIQLRVRHYKLQLAAVASFKTLLPSS